MNIRILRRIALTIAALGGMWSLSWAGATSTMTIDSLEPPGPYFPGDKVTAKGSMTVNVARGWGGGGISTTRVDHSVSVSLDWKATPDDGWPELPDFLNAGGYLRVRSGDSHVAYEGDRSRSSSLWSGDVDPPLRMVREDPMEASMTVPFEVTFTIPESCFGARLRGTLEHTVGSNWSVTVYFYNNHPLAVEVPGKNAIDLICENRKYTTMKDQVMVSENAETVSVKGRVIDANLGLPLANTIVTGICQGKKEKFCTGRDGGYELSFRNEKGGSGSDSASCDFRMESGLPAYNLTLEVTADGYHPKVLKKTFRSDLKGIRLSGEVVRAGGPAIPRPKAKVVVNGRTTQCNSSSDGWVTAYLMLNESAEREIPWMPAIALSPVDVPEGTVNPEDWKDAYEKTVAQMVDKAPAAYKKVWLALGLANAVKKDLEDVAKGKTGFENLETFRKNIKRPSGEITEAMKLLGDMVTSKDPLISKANEWDGKLKDYNEKMKQITGKDILKQIKGENAFKAYWKNAAQYIAERNELL